jgi:hypothetical protein
MSLAAYNGNRLSKESFWTFGFEPEMLSRDMCRKTWRLLRVIDGIATVVDRW